MTLLNADSTVALTFCLNGFGGGRNPFQKDSISSSSAIPVDAHWLPELSGVLSIQYGKRTESVSHFEEQARRMKGRKWIFESGGFESVTQLFTERGTLVERGKVSLLYLRTGISRMLLDSTQRTLFLVSSTSAMIG